MALPQTATIIGIISIVVGAGALGHQMYSSRAKTIYEEQSKSIISEKSHFYCALQADPKVGGAVWTVMYRNENGYTKPWLRMVRSMGGYNEDGQKWNPKERCEEIAPKMERYKQDGLIAFDYREEPATPKQYILCARTRLSPNNCSQVLTLKPKDDPYDELHKVIGALVPNNSAAYENYGSKSPSLPDLNSGIPFSIPLEDQL